MSELTYHIPVLLEESIEALQINAGGIYVDLTFGGGGHSAEILKRLSSGHLYGMDQDEDALLNVPSSEHFTFIKSNFQYLGHFMDFYDVSGVDGVLGDLGVSSHHFDEADRGFSFRFDAPLDMRMNQNSKQSAKEVINAYSEEQLSDLFFLYGEIRNARKLANSIHRHRSRKTIETISDFSEIVKTCTPERNENKYLSKAFQAIRMEVNQELEVLKKVLTASLELIKPGGRLVMITYHSLEDRLVKNFFNTGNFEGRPVKDFYGVITSPLKVVNKKVIRPTAAELGRNPRARSAKLRIAEKK